MIHQTFKYILTLSVCLILSMSVNPASADKPKCEKQIQSLSHFDWHDIPKPMTDEPFFNMKGEKLTLEDYKGKVVLLNHWAIWCAPCIREMPSIMRLSEQMAGKDVVILPLSMDRGGVKKVRAFVQKKGWVETEFFNDPKMRVARKSGVSGIPASQVIDKNGNEIGRLVGPFEWDGPEIVDLLSCLAQ